jgi:hypothetical protein
MIAMTIASIIIIGISATYTAMGRAAGRLVLAERALPDRAQPRCRPPATTDGAALSPPPPSRCDLPERCEYDTVSQSCRSTTSPST